MDESAQIHTDSGTPTVDFSDVQGGWTGAGGTGNIDADPLFVNPAANDVHLSACSPCIDVGDNAAPSLPATDLDGNARIFNGTVDMGAYEYGVAHSDSDGDGVIDPCDVCPGSDDNVDTDNDSVPDGCDPCPADNPDDSDDDGVCDSDDVCPGFDDNLDTDNDSVPDDCDLCFGDNATGDGDGDGTCDGSDNCPLTFNPDQADADTDGILGAWRFDEGAGTTAIDSVASIDGSINDATYVPDAAGTVLDFDGDNDWVDFGDVDALDTPSAFSVAMRFLRRSEVDNPSDNHGVRNILLAQTALAFNDNLEIGSEGQDIKLYLDTTSATPPRIISLSPGIVNDTWHHLVLTYDANEAGGVVTVYLDGQEAGSDSAWSGPLADSTGSNLSVGASRVLNADPGGDFDGQIDDLMVFDRAVTPPEVQLIHEHGVDAVSDGIGDACDSCPEGSDLLDEDSDGVPDACDPCPLDNPDDTDGDGVCDSDDPCPLDNPDDTDSDLVCESDDNCPDHANPDQEDCDDDGVGDVCAIADGAAEDCNMNDVPDECDIADETSSDDNGNGIPDECEGPMCGSCPTDADGDGSTGSADLPILLGAWGEIPDGAPQAVVCLDGNGDGFIGSADLPILLGAWGPCP